MSFYLYNRDKALYSLSYSRAVRRRWNSQIYIDLLKSTNRVSGKQR